MMSLSHAKGAQNAPVQKQLLPKRKSRQPECSPPLISDNIYRASSSPLFISQRARVCGMRNNIRRTRESSRWLVIEYYVCCRWSSTVCCVSGAPPRSRVCRSIGVIQYSVVRLCDRRARLQLGCTAWGKQCIWITENWQGAAGRFETTPLRADEAEILRLLYWAGPWSQVVAE